MGSTTERPMTVDPGRRSTPRGLRSQKASRQAHRLPHRPHPQLRTARQWSPGNHRAGRSPQQSYQTSPRRRPAASPSSRRAQPQTHRCPLPYAATCHARRLPRARDRRLRIDKFFVGRRPEAPTSRPIACRKQSSCLMLGGRAHPGFRLWGLPRCIDQGVDLRSSAGPHLRVAISLQRAAANTVGSKTAAKLHYSHNRAEAFACHARNQPRCR